jgi:hypothetical protein
MGSGCPLDGDFQIYPQWRGVSSGSEWAPITMSAAWGANERRNPDVCARKCRGYVLIILSYYGIITLDF